MQTAVTTAPASLNLSPKLRTSEMVCDFFATVQGCTPALFYCAEVQLIPN